MSQYHQFKNYVLKRDKYTCQFCGAKAYTILYKNYIKGKYMAVPFYLVLEVTKSVCIRCYWRKIKAAQRRNSYQPELIWKSKK